MLAVGPPLRGTKDYEVVLWSAGHRFPDHQDYENGCDQAPGDPDEGEKRSTEHRQTSPFQASVGSMVKESVAKVNPALSSITSMSFNPVSGKFPS
jgi:hypothetical protein